MSLSQLWLSAMAAGVASAPIQCIQHTRSLTTPLESGMIGYSTASQSVFLIGGEQAGSLSDDVLQWDTKSSLNWFVDIGSPTPTSMASEGAQIVATIDEVIYVVAPEFENTVIYPFNTTTKQWQVPIPFTTPVGASLTLSDPCVTHNESHIIIVDGYMPNREDGPIYIFFYAILQREWTTHTILTPFGSGTVQYGWYSPYCSYAQGNLYIFGGKYYVPSSNSKVYLDQIYRYDIALQQFTTLATLPTPRAYGVAVYDEVDHIYLVGGRLNDSAYLNDILIFEVSTEQLMTETIAAQFPFSNSVSMILDEQLWIFGGLDRGTRTNIVQKCNISSFLVTTSAPTATPTSVAPTTAEPTTAAPTTAAPTTAAPTTAAPTTAAPTTAAPTTAAPTTAAPTTAAPTTAVHTSFPTSKAPTVAVTTINLLYVGLCIASVCLCFTVFGVFKCIQAERQHQRNDEEHVQAEQEQHQVEMHAVAVPFPRAHRVDSDSEVDEKKEEPMVANQPGAGEADFGRDDSDVDNRWEGLRASMVAQTAVVSTAGGLEADEFEVMDDHETTAGANYSANHVHAHATPAGLEEDEFEVVDDNETGINSTRGE